MPHHWTLDPDVVFLNHGSFGACPRAVLEVQSALRARLERQPVQFMARELEGAARRGARGAGARSSARAPADLAFVPNATSGVNTVLRSLDFAPGDELLTTDHAYGACRNALHFVAERSGARVVTATVPFPIADPDAVVEAVLARGDAADAPRAPRSRHEPDRARLPDRRAGAGARRARRRRRWSTARTRSACCRSTSARIGAAYYTGNCHKWLCAPKGAGFLHVRRDRQDDDPAARDQPRGAARAPGPLALPARVRLDGHASIRRPTSRSPRRSASSGALLPGGWPALRAHNRALALAGRRAICATRSAIPHPRARRDDRLARRGADRRRLAGSRRPPRSTATRCRTRCASAPDRGADPPVAGAAAPAAADLGAALQYGRRLRAARRSARLVAAD